MEASSCRKASSSFKRSGVASTSFFFHTKTSPFPRFSLTLRLPSTTSLGAASKRSPAFATGVSRAAHSPRLTHRALSYGGIAIGRNPAVNNRSRVFICCGVNSGMERRRSPQNSRCSRICFRGRALELRQNFAQGPYQFVPRNMALLELNAEPEGLIFRLKLKNKRVRPLRARLLFTALAPRFIPRQAALQDAMQHLHHFLFRGLPRNLQQQRLRPNALLDAPLPQCIRNIAQRKRLRHRR